MALNLLPSQAKFQAAKVNILNKIKIYLIAVSALWVLVMLYAFTMWFVERAKVNKTIKDNERVNSEFKKLATNVALSSRMKYQAKLVGKVLAERYEYGTPLSKITGLFSEKVIIDKFEIKDQNNFTLTGTFKGNKNMNEIENKVNDINNGKVEGFSKAKVVSLSTISGLWKFEMEVSIK